LPLTAPGQGPSALASVTGAVMAAETMETKQALVRQLERAISKAKARKHRRPNAHPPTKMRQKCTAAANFR